MINATMQSSAGVLYNFVGIRSREGRPMDSLVLDLEQIQTDGVDGTRYRGRGRRWRPWAAELMMHCPAGYEQATIWAQELDQLQGDNVRVDVRLAPFGTWRVYLNVRLVEMHATASATRLVGIPDDDGTLGIFSTTWTTPASVRAMAVFQLTQPAVIQQGPTL